MSGDYKIVRSNYTIRTKHKNLKNGAAIYERDFMTTSNLGAFEGKSFPLGEHNFKMVHRETDKKGRKRKYGEWLKNGEEEFWTDSTINGGSKSTENVIKIKPNYRSLLDFAYYGSTTELVRTTVENIIEMYPGEMVVTDAIFKYFEKMEGGMSVYKVLGSSRFINPCVVKNPFRIDITTKDITDKEGDEIKNPLRYFALSSRYYGAINIKGEVFACMSDWKVEEYGEKECYKNGDLMNIIYMGTYENEEGDLESIKFYEYYYEGNGILIADGDKYSGVVIRPTNAKIEEFFEGLDDFGKVMLNRETNPYYTMALDYPHETEDGIKTYVKKFTWPREIVSITSPSKEKIVVSEWNIEINGPSYTSYLNQLLPLCSFYDEYFTNNLWGRMVHSSIKNLDRTYEVEGRDEDEEDVKLGVTRMQGFMLSCARLFDDLKRCIDNTQNNNLLTYDDNNNVPDYFISDKLEMKGWDIKSVINGLDKEAVTDILFSGTLKTYTPNDTNLRFMKNLVLNSESILSRKGTQYAIEMVLGLFGMKSYNVARHTTYRYDYTIGGVLKSTYNFGEIPFDDNGSRVEYEKFKIDPANCTASEAGKLYDYKIEEYVATVKNKPEDIIPEYDYLPVERWNMLKKNYIGESEWSENTIQGLPIKFVYLIKEDESGNTQTYKYVIPWFESAEEIDGEPYFQLYGGWGKQYSKDIDNEMAPKIKTIYESENFHIYEETQKYLTVVKNINALSYIMSYELSGNDIFYVHDVSDFEEKYGKQFEEGRFSNYFIIDDVTKCKQYASGITEGDGWKNITLNEIEEGKPNGIRVLYLESIIDEVRGNNPHVGFGKYDDGETYLDYFRQFFKYSIENNNFTDDAIDCETGELNPEIKNVGFSGLTVVKDNQKVWYFTDNINKNDIKVLTGGNSTGTSIGNMYTTSSWLNNYNYKEETKSTKHSYEEVEELPTADRNSPNYIHVKGNNKYYRKERDLSGVYNGRYVKGNFYNGSIMDVSPVGKDYTNGFFENDLVTNNFETSENTKKLRADVAASYSVINTKKMKITFTGELTYEKEFKPYLNNVILPYLKQVIPSTTILEIKIDGEEAEYNCMPIAQVLGFTDEV